MPGAEHPGTLQAPPSAPRHHTRQPRDNLRPLGKNARPSSPNTGRDYPGKPAPERLRHAARVESPAQSPGAPRTPQRSRAEPSPERHPRTPTLHATGPRLPPPQRHPAPKGPARSHRHPFAPLHTAQGPRRNHARNRHGTPRHDSRPALSASASHAPTPGQSPTPQKKCARILSEHPDGTTPANQRQNA